MTKSIQLKISGRVQGVGFRYYTKKKAAECNILGYVQNKTDGSVFIEAQGDETDIETFVSWCHKGPAWARVDKCLVSEIPFADFKAFSIR